jgi:phosphatidate cytidylyltransferase
MLKQRIFTALLLFAGLMAALFLLPALYWGMLMAVVSAIAAWEWGALAGLKQRGRLVFGGGVLLACLGIGVFQHFNCTETLREIFAPLDLSHGDIRGGELLYSYTVKTCVNPFPEVVGNLLFLLTGLFWCLLVPFWLWRRWRPQQAGVGKGLLLLLGACLILATWFAFVKLRGVHPLWLLMALGIAWVSDISAYFVGRKFGGKKLAPNISPGKTWAGVWGALAGVTLYEIIVVSALWKIVGADVSAITGDISAELVFCWLPVFLFLAVLGIMGDLFESLLKRQVDIKDSSHILPGHGGVLDRIDSLLAILPCFALLPLLFISS